MSPRYSYSLTHNPEHTATSLSLDSYALTYDNMHTNTIESAWFNKFKRS